MRRITCACHRINTVLGDMFLEKYVKSNYGTDSLERFQPLYTLMDESKKLVEYFKSSGLMKELQKSLKQHVTRFRSCNIASVD